MPAILSRLAPTFRLLLCSLIVAIGFMQADVSARGQGQSVAQERAELSAAVRTTLTADAAILAPAIALIDQHKPRAAVPVAGALPALPELTPPPPRPIPLSPRPALSSRREISRGVRGQRRVVRRAGAAPPLSGHAQA
ncbi:hypothetical protein CLG85_025930, partial [Yangia mangrovi]